MIFFDEGEEVLVNYGIKMAQAPDWYKAEFVNHLRKDRGWNDEQVCKTFFFVADGKNKLER